MFRISTIFIFIVSFGYAQEKTYPEIDRAFNNTFSQVHTTGEFEKGIVLTTKLIQKCKQLNYQRGIGIGHLDIASYLCNLTRYDESLKNLEISEKKIDENDITLRAQLYNEYANVYDYLGVSEISLKYYNKAISLGKNIKSIKEKKTALTYSYTNKANLFESLKNNDSAYIYYQKTYKIIQDPISSANMAACFINFRKNEIDSAAYYLKTATDSLNTYKYHSYNRIIVWEVSGDFYYKKKQYHQALEYYFKALNLSKQNKDVDERQLMYKSIYNTYKSLKEDEKASEYLQKYTALNDSLHSANSHALNLSIDKLMKDKDEEKQKIQYNTFYIYIFILFIVIIMVGFAYFFYTRKKIEKQTIIQKQQEEITNSKIEKRSLEHKVNDAFHEVLELAKKNDPSFLARFKEVYPEFCERLLHKYPDIVASEFIFCGYLKLNLSTKEIAVYTFVTERTIQSRKSRLRKKMNIPSDEDLYVWISKI